MSFEKARKTQIKPEQLTQFEPILHKRHKYNPTLRHSIALLATEVNLPCKVYKPGHEELHT